MSREWQVALAGEGGQGLLVAGIILGTAAVKDGKNATQTASYGIASRGGFSKADVVVSDGEIAYPSVEKPNAVLVLSQLAMEKYYGKVPAGCFLIYDSTQISGSYAGENVIGLPLTEEIRKTKLEKGYSLSLNILGLAALIELTGMVSTDSLAIAVKDQFKKGHEMNQIALETGRRLAKDVEGDRTCIR